MSLFRLPQLKQWLCEYFNDKSLSLNALTGDAGFRNYYRFLHQGTSYIAVDAIPDKSNNLAFVELQQAFKKQHINVPEIVTHDLEQGFFCLSDFGDVLFGHVLTQENMNVEYKKAIDLLPNIARVELITGYALPIYDDAFIRLELSIFPEWLLDRHLGISLTVNEKNVLETCFDFLVSNALEQPQVTVHRDFHSRNLMLLSEISQNSSLGVIDFQDAVFGPITYDVVSLLRDCYVKWPTHKVEELFSYFCQLMESKMDLPNISTLKWKRWFDLMGIQRHVKASGIFARLHHRDDKPGYLKDIPLTLSYIVEVSQQYPELLPLHQIIVDKVLPELKKQEVNQ